MGDRISLGMPLIHRIVESALVFLLRDVARYRFNVIRSNLASSFVYRSQQELRSDVNKNYRFLARVIRQIIPKPSYKYLSKRLTIWTIPELEQWLEEGKSIIVAMGHVGNWEWSGLYLGMSFPGQVCALYKRIKSVPLNNWMVRRRKLLRGYLVESGKMTELIRLIQSKPVMILMIADQNPGNDKGIIWTRFFDKNTAFVSGPETLAVKYGLPVVYLKTISNADGSYTLEFDILSDGVSNMEPGKITKSYAEALEHNIKAQRTEWLWSHKRWKRSGTSNNEQLTIHTDT